MDPTTLKQRLLTALETRITPDAEALMALRRILAGLMKEAEVDSGTRDRFVETHKFLQNTKPRLQEAWDEFQALFSELEVDLEEWLRSSDPLPKLPAVFFSQTKPRDASRTTPQTKTVSGEPEEVIDQRSRGIIEKLRELALWRTGTPEELADHREELQRLDRVRNFIATQWHGITGSDLTQRTWSREVIERAQLDLLGQIKGLEDRLHSPSSAASASPRASWSLRDYQKAMIAGIKRDLPDKNLPWLGLASPMQTGKSYLIGPVIQAVREYYGSSVRIVVLSAAEKITDQIIGDLVGEFPLGQVGRYDRHCKDVCDITVASYKALAWHTNLDRDFPNNDGRPTVIINDEAYSTQAASFQKIYSHFGLGTAVKEKGVPVLKPTPGNGRVIGFSGTGSGLEGYHISGQLDLLTAWKAGRIRHLNVDRIPVTMSSKRSEMAGEKMIWWEATIKNARALVEIYDQQMKKEGKKRTLTYVPTTDHADLFEEAMAEKYGLGYSHAYHSKQTDGQNDDALEHHEKRGGNLTSIGMLSRGYRGTGVDGVYLTYCSSSAELTLQRVGRAWGVPEDQALPDLGVIEVAWSEQGSFGAVSVMMGLIEAPRRRFSTRELETSLPVIERKKKQKVERDRQITIGKVIPLFQNVPLAEDWRMRFLEVVSSLGVPEIAQSTGLAQNVIAGFAVGCLPVRHDQVLRMKDLLGGVENAQALWIHSWRQVVDDILGGKERLGDALDEKLISWSGQKGETAELCGSLDEILSSHFRVVEPKSAPQTPKEKLFEEFKEILKEAQRPDENETKLKNTFLIQAENFCRSLEESSAHIFRGRFLSDKPQTRGEISKFIGTNRSAIDKKSSFLRQLFLARIRAIYFSKEQILQLDIRIMALSNRVTNALIKENLTRISDVAQRSGSELLKIAGLGYKGLREIKYLLEECGLHLSYRLPGEKEPDASSAESDPQTDLPEHIAYMFVDELELSVRSANALQNANIAYIGQLATWSESELLRTKNFGRKSLKEIIEVLGEIGVTLRKEGTSKTPWQPREDSPASGTGQRYPSTPPAAIADPQISQDLLGSQLYQLVVRLKHLENPSHPEWLSPPYYLWKFRRLVYRHVALGSLRSRGTDYLLSAAVTLRIVGDSQGAHHIYQTMRDLSLASSVIIDGSEREHLEKKNWLEEPIKHLAEHHAIGRYDLDEFLFLFDKHPLTDPLDLPRLAWIAMRTRLAWMDM